jgi:hypothetical protein
MTVIFEIQAKLYCERIAQIIQLIINNAVRLILDNFGIVGFLFFGRIPVDLSHFSLHFDKPKSPQIFYFERFKARLILAGGNAGSFICIGRISTVSDCIKS